MTDREIEKHVNRIVDAWVKASKTKPTKDQEELIDAVAALTINFLQNINTVADELTS